jgi:Flp pilus assembly protein TadG
MSRPAGREAGTAAAEFAVVAPLLLLMIVAVVFVGRLARAEGQVEGAARDAARAAAARRTSEAATDAARVEAGAALRAAGVSCRSLGVAVDASQFRAGGSVAVRVTCTVSLADLDLLGLPGSTTRSATARAPIDLYRQTG